MFERYTDRDAHRQSAEWWLQLIAFGAMLADAPKNGKPDKGAKPSFRERVEIGDFSDWDMRIACETLKGKNRDAQAAGIHRILRECGVDWCATDGPPLDAVVSKLKTDGEFQMAIDWLNMVSHRASPGYTPMDAKAEFLERLKAANDELYGTRERGKIKAEKRKAQ